MRIWNIKLDPHWKMILLGAALAVFAALCVVSAAFARADGGSAEEKPFVDEQAASDYLREHGEADAAQLDCVQIRIPPEFDAVYEEYNDLQLRSGRDLSGAKGKTALKLTFELTGESARYAVLLVRDGRVIGGHLTNGEYGGEYLPLE